MADESHLDGRYFVDQSVYNCPFCKRRNVLYWIDDAGVFDWSDKKNAYYFRVQCKSCSKHSFHLSFEKIVTSSHNAQNNSGNTILIYRFTLSDEQLTQKPIDSRIFYSVPSSFFALDSRVHSTLRELIIEAEGCLKMNYLTGSSACVRKCIYELLELEGIKGNSYKNRIKQLKKKFKSVDGSYFDVLASIQSGTSDIVHEDSWDHWDASHLRLFLETLKGVLNEMYVVPDERKQRVAEIAGLLAKVKKKEPASVSNEDNTKVASNT